MCVWAGTRLRVTDPRPSTHRVTIGIPVVLQEGKSSTSSLVSCRAPQPRIDFTEAGPAPGPLARANSFRVFWGDDQMRTYAATGGATRDLRGLGTATVAGENHVAAK